MSGKATGNAFFVSRRMVKSTREEVHFVVCFVDLDQAFGRVLRKVVELAMRKMRIPEVMMKAVMSLYEVASNKIKVWIQLLKQVSCNS